MEQDVMLMDKAQLKNFALKMFKVKLDGRKSKVYLQEQVQELIKKDTKSSTTDATKKEKSKKKQKVKTPTKKKVIPYKDKLSMFGKIIQKFNISEKHDDEGKTIKAQASFPYKKVPCKYELCLGELSVGKSPVINCPIRSLPSVLNQVVKNEKKRWVLEKEKKRYEMLVKKGFNDKQIQWLSSWMKSQENFKIAKKIGYTGHLAGSVSKWINTHGNNILLGNIENLNLLTTNDLLKKLIKEYHKEFNIVCNYIEYKSGTIGSMYGKKLDSLKKY